MLIRVSINWSDLPDSLETQMETVTITLQSIASQMQQLAQQMQQQSVILTELSKQIGKRRTNLDGESSQSESRFAGKKILWRYKPEYRNVLPPPDAEEKLDLESEVQTEVKQNTEVEGVFDLELEGSINLNNNDEDCDIQTEVTLEIEEETEKKMKLDFYLSSPTLVSGRLIKLQAPPEIVNTESGMERKGKQEATINPTTPLNLSYPPSPEPPPDSGQPVTTVPRRAPPPKPPDLHDFVDGEVYAKSSVKKRGKVQMSLGGPPLKSSEPLYSGCNFVHKCGFVAEGQQTTPLLSHVSPNGHSLSVMCYVDTMQCEFGQLYNQKVQAKMVISSNVPAAQIWSTTKNKATYTGIDMYQLPGVLYCLVFDHVISETPHHQRSTWQELHALNLMTLFTKYKQLGVDGSKAAKFLFKHKLADSLVYSLILANFTCLRYSLVIRLAMLTLILVMKHKGKDGNPLLIEITQQWKLMDFLKYFRKMFDVVMILSLEVLPCFLSPCDDDSLVQPIWERMHVYVLRSYDDKNALWESTLFQGDRKYGLVSRKYGSCIQFGAKSYDLMVWDAMMCGYGSKGHSAPYVNMISRYSSFFMGQQYSKEFNFPMVVAVKEVCWRVLFTFHGLLNFVFDRGKFGVKERVAAREYMLLSMHGLVCRDTIEFNSIKQAIGSYFPLP